MAAERAPRIDPNATAGTLAQLGGVPGGVTERRRVIGHLLEAQARLRDGDPRGAEIMLGEALELAPGHADALNLLSVALGHLGRPGEGEAASRRALAGRPADPGYLLNLGNRQNEQGGHGEAIATYQRARAAAPDDRRIRNVLARALTEAGRYDEAEAALAAAADDDPEALVRRADLEAFRGRPEAAMDLFERALALDPLRPGWWLQLARTAEKAERQDTAERAAGRVLEFEPGHAEARVILANVLQRKREFARMFELLERVPPIGLHGANAANLRGMAKFSQGQVEAGLEAMCEAGRLAPDAVELRMTAVMHANYDPETDAVELRRRHVEIATAFLDAKAPAVLHFDQSRDPERPLRIGYVSPDFRNHSVAYFMAPVFEAFDRERFELFAYADVVRPDPITGHLAAKATVWRDVAHIDDAALAAQIRDDRIDVLVELAGFTKGNRLAACARRPAPVQISYLGYPNTTGMRQIDYRITDAIADPDGFDEHYTETLIRLGRCFLCYAIPEHAPPIQAAPCTRNGHVTFGSFNSLAKVNRKVVGLWAEILRAVPTSRLLIKAPGSGEPATQDHLRAAFRDAGIDGWRIDFAPYVALPAEHLAVYNQVDVALDTFPYTGTTTTCEALWMGVPVVTLAGARHSARVGASLLHAIGFDAGIATGPEEYVLTAKLLASRPELIATCRSGLRQDLCRSELCDMAAHGRALEEAYRAVWRLWCAAA